MRSAGLAHHARPSGQARQCYLALLPMPALLHLAAMYLIPRDADWGSTREDLASETHNYQRPQTET